MYTVEAIVSITGGRLQQQGAGGSIVHLVYDSRKIAFAQSSLFFAFSLGGSEGYRFLEDAYRKGIRHFVVGHEVAADRFPGSDIIVVENVLKSFQALAAFHRSQFNIP
ncbi:MAG: hypothetical protein ACO1NX_02640, partial [Chitinophagaceae bacterium]